MPTYEKATGITINDLLKFLDEIQREDKVDGNTQILLGKASIGNTATKLYYNDGLDESPWYGEFVVIE